MEPAHMLVSEQDPAAADKQTVRELRLRQGLTLQALATRADVARKTLRLIERGESRPHPTTLHRLADALGCAPEDIAESPKLPPPPKPPIPGLPEGTKPTLEQMRLYRKLTMTGLAKLAHVSQTTVRNLENEVYVPHLRTVQKLSEALRCSVDAIAWPGYDFDD